MVKTLSTSFSNIKGFETTPLNIYSLLCIHVKEPTKYPKLTHQISGGIWSVNVTIWVFQVDQCKHSFGHNLLDLKQIITKFGQMNLLVKSFCMQV